MRLALSILLGLALPLPAAAAPLALQPLRYDEDWRPACLAQTAEAPPLKCLHLPGASLLSLGGELRERGEAFRNPAFGLRAGSDHVLLHRALLHGDLRIGAALRIFVQLGYLNQSGRKLGPVPTDRNELDLMQGFAEGRLPLAGGHVTLRAGRQEVALGSQRIISVRDGPNARRAFDGARLFWSGERTRIEVLYLKPVDLAPGTFDDSSSRTEAVFGGYGTRKLGTGASLDLYVLGYRRNLARFAAASGREERTSFGMRFAGRARRLDWNVEAVVQHGRVGARRIRAWTIASDTGYRLNLPLGPRIGLKADVASGDHNAGGLGTFNALYPKLPYFSEANLLVPANLIDLHPQVELRPARTLSLSVGADFAWRETTRDAIYLFPLLPLAGTAGAPGRYTGTQAISELGWEAAPHVTVAASYVHFAPGAVVRRAGGHSGDFGMVSLDWKW